MKRRTIGALIAVSVTVGAVAWNATRDKPVSVALTTVERGDVRSTVSNTRAGTVDACKRARMAPILGGQIASLPVAEGDKVVTRWTAQGTHQGDFFGIPASGKPVAVKAIHIHQIVDGKIAALWEEFDMFGLQQQLGIENSG